MFFRGTAGAFLVFDLGSKKSFSDVDNWKKVMQDSTDTKYVTTLVGNKADLPNREVTYDEAAKYA